MTSVIIKIEKYDSDKEKITIESICKRCLVHDIIMNRIEKFLSSYIGKNDISNALEQLGKRFNNIIVNKIDNGYIIDVYEKKTVVKEIKKTIKEEGWFYSTEKEITDEITDEIEEKRTIEFYTLNYINNDDNNKSDMIPRAINYKVKDDIKTINFNKVLEELKTYLSEK